MKDFYNNWQIITSDTTILQAVRGYKIEFDSNLPLPERTYAPRQFRRNLQEIAAIQAEIDNLSRKNVIERCSSLSGGGFVSNIFTRPKKSGGLRVILDLSDLNEFVLKHHFKMDNIHTVAQLLSPNCYMASIDLQDAYYTISIDAGFRKYLRFPWQGHLWQYKALPNGLSSAPRLFTKMLKPILASLREAGHIVVGYLDDIILIGESESQVESAVRATIQAFSELGFKIHFQKSEFKPTQKIKFLGFTVNSTEMTIKLPDDKVQNIREECVQLLNQPKPTVRHVAHVIGKLVSTFPAVQHGPLFYRNLEKDKISALRSNMGHYDRFMVLSKVSRNELEWWITNIQDAWAPVMRDKPNFEIRTDASGSGWGATDMHTRTGGRWNDFELKKAHGNAINYLETLAVGLALKSFHIDTKNSHILIRTDNTTTVSYVNNMGGIKSPQCNEVAVDIWKWCLERNLWITAAYLPGSQNTEADYESRHFNDRTEWMLHKSYFEKVVQKFGRPSIDIFASRLNTQLERYISWFPDPHAESVDAFTLDWSNLDFYAFPPFCLLARCIQKIKSDKASGILVVPNWPTQAWFPCLNTILMEQPLLLRSSANLLIQPITHIPHPLNDRIDLLCCRVSGSPSRPWT